MSIETQQKFVQLHAQQPTVRSTFNKSLQIPRRRKRCRPARSQQASSTETMSHQPRHTRCGPQYSR